MKKNAFTLVELLVVISIITILASLLLPALQNVRHQATMLRCANNLKQIGIGLITYTGDYDGHYPNHRRKWNNASAWKYPHLFSTWGVSTGFRDEYSSGDRNAFFCPIGLEKLPPASSAYKDYRDWPKNDCSTLYAYFAGTDENGGNVRCGPKRVNKVKSSSRTTLIADDSRFNNGSSTPFTTGVYWNHDAEHPYYNPPYIEDEAGVYCTYADGHVSWIGGQEEIRKHAQPMCGSNSGRWYVAEQPGD